MDLVSQELDGTNITKKPVTKFYLFTYLEVGEYMEYYMNG